MALDDVKHVEAHAIIRRVVEEAPIVSDETRDAAEQWLAENHPPPRAYTAAMRSLAQGAENGMGT